ncbi:MAG: hypothetical protein HY323_07205 [Betaproteobacteria bacterium]|nr:hypothetical protein [Betaproteobacteria bacterium]
MTGSAIKALRRALGLSARQFGAIPLIDVAECTVVRWQSGAVPVPARIAAVCDLLAAGELTGHLPPLAERRGWRPGPRTRKDAP